MKNIVLASTSRYRKELLGRLRIPFTTARPDVDESRRDGESPSDLALRLASEKARAVADAHPDALIIGSDQVAVLGSRILSKPGSHEAAVEQLTAASGRCVEFLTAIALLNASTGRIQSDIVAVSAHFRTLSQRMIENYLRLDEPYDSAGSFKAESLGIALFEKLEEDDPTALIGLPLIRLTRMLEEEGVTVI